MKKLLALALLAFVLLPLLPSKAFAGDVASFPYFGESEILRYNAKFILMMDMLAKKEKLVLTPYTVAASDTVTASGIYSAIFLQSTSGNTLSNLSLATSTATSMQLLYVFNDSATATNIFNVSGDTIATASASGGRAHLIFASGSWRMLEDQ